MKNLSLQGWGAYFLLFICLAASLPIDIKAMPLYQEDNSKTQANALLDQGYSLLKKDEFGEGLKKFELALPFFHKAGDRHGEAFCLFSIALVKHYLLDFSGALRAYDMSLKIWQELGDLEWQGFILDKI